MLQISVKICLILYFISNNTCEHIQRHLGGQAEVGM